MITTAANLARRWTALGALFNVPAAKGTPDVERLLLDTARLAGTSPPQFVMAITWLAAYGELVARHRLARLVKVELQEVHRPAMGLLLESAVRAAPRHAHRFRAAIKWCLPAVIPGPLLDVDRGNSALMRLAEIGATPLSKKWGLWLDPVELKFDALRPREWIARRHPALGLRALVGGDLVASILAEAGATPCTFDSEVELAQRCGASRPAIREALAKLRLSGIVEQRRRGRRNQICVRIPAR